MLVAPIVGMSPFGPSTAIATDSRGRASVRLQFGTVAGAAELLVTVPEFGYSTTVPYTVEPALAFSITVAPQDTVVPVGASFASRSKVVDRFGNPLADPVALTDPSANLTVQGNQITATGPGRGTVTVRASDLSDVLRVFVGPSSDVSGLTQSELVLFANNGDVSSRATLGQSGDPYTADWSVNGNLLVADDRGRRTAPGDPAQRPVDYPPDAGFGVAAVSRVFTRRAVDLLRALRLRVAYSSRPSRRQLGSDRGG